MKNKKLILEFTQGEMFSDQILQMAINNNCFPSANPNPLTDKVTGKQAIYINAPKNYPNTPHVFVYADKTLSFRNKMDESTPSVDIVGKKWVCDALEAKTNYPNTPAEQDIVKQVETNLGGKLWGQINDAETGNYRQINLKDRSNWPQQAEGLKNQPAYKNIFANDFYMWIPVGVTQAAGDIIAQQRARIKEFTDQGWFDINQQKPTSSDTNSALGIKKINLKTYEPDIFTVDYILWKRGDQITDWDKERMGTGVIQGWGDNQKQKDCRRTIKDYIESSEKGTHASQEDLDNDKRKFLLCVRTKDYNPILDKKIQSLNFKEVIQGMNGPLDYNTRRVQKESYNRNLKSVIRENLIQISENKKKGLLQEGKIVNNRLQIIAESKNLNSKKEQKVFAKELFTEMVYLNSQGFEPQVLTEGFWDFLGGLFPKGLDSIGQYIKEYATKWLLEKLSVDTNSWMGNILISAIGNIDIADIPKLWSDCNYVTKILSKSVGEGALRKLQNQTVGEGPMFDILRNTLIEVLEDTSFGEKIEASLGSVVCPLIGTLGGKVESATEMIKQKALGSGQTT